MELLEARHLTISIRRAPPEVYAFIADPQHLPRWASGLSEDIHEENGEWIAKSPMGKVRVRFAPPNELGVVDHDVTTPSGETFHNPLRVLPNAGGSEVVFTLLRQPGVSDEAYEKDAKTIEKDLRTLKKLLEA
jgi:uncharacterized protein YndB with AHSA1/START domain